ncbi:MAG: hypothetical protein GXO20_07495 [Thermodesulfobacteria bacterium]|nr:hypothetical protein [Thermodesulfobacteriota bacterium]
MAEKNQIHVDPANLIFAKVMEIVTYIGIAVMIIFGLLYLVGISSFVDIKAAIAHWHLPVVQFWQEVVGIHISGYDWFLKNLTAMDCLSMLGICILALAPFAAIIAAWPKVGATHKVLVLLFFILVVEYLFAILKPIILPGVGGH